jgi:putative selenate reductase
MPDLVPFPFDRLVTRMFTELEERRAIFDLPEKKFVRARPGVDRAVRFHDKVASSALGPAAGPHSQLAQNIVLSFLGGGRIFELKTVQIMDRLQIPRPCIDMRTVGYNVEWSQELTLEQSLEEYVKAAMLIEMLVASGKLGLAPADAKVVFDMSVGYDLAGIRSERVTAFIHGLKDATAVIDRLRAQIPASHAHLRDLAFPTRLSSTLTLSTFHGCPPDEIERITAHLLEAEGLDCIVKLNPTLLGKVDLRHLFNEVLGYPDHVPDSAFDADAHYAQAVEFVGRLRDKAKDLGRSMGIKLSNTLVVENPGDFLPGTEKLRYLSGAPLHVLAMNLVGRFRQTFGADLPVSYSGGIDKRNFADAVALGLVPVTVCSDLLQTGGYARMQPYFDALDKQMAEAGARTIDELVVLGHGHAAATLASLDNVDPAARAACDAALAAHGDLAAAAGPALFARWHAAAKLRNTETYVAGLATDPRYARAQNLKAPPKRGTKLALFDCITCDKCVPVCPNDANFTYPLPKAEIPIVKLRADGAGGWSREAGATLKFEEKHQLANFADLCNECGNCDVFCPEDGGPYLVKPRFFGSEAHWATAPVRDGFHVARGGGAIAGRFGGKEYRLAVDGGKAAFTGDGFALTFAEADPEATVAGTAAGEVDLTYFHILNWLRKAITTGGVNYVNA